ncbi:hypothetical protein GLAREA_07596 [Glarea lozoyensis ATCC 20868]|uniref:F-box domain-containing protein n=1 Tax=Glarea lozoyensis (strain ATCC 20868 / MF5171) TaxID=1116229 RepID=S3E1V2_GLAL2|nr:uncharacterized protein GLAREA_07596 [Glarea lozoyensis ATCC 20868]EPE32463.1 hypothetical protein GLAREA_07596 [Glarea lozoyensis ATCC 20868]
MASSTMLAPPSPVTQALYQIPAAVHSRKSCPFHDEISLKSCSGLQKKGGPCIVKAVERMNDGLPTCKRHREQVRIATVCNAPMPCGFPCGALVEKRPHAYQLCYRHWSYGPCYFLQLPLELRCRIYDLLFPNSLVSARFQNLPGASERTFPSILRANRQIHSEAAYTLYGRRTFVIEISRFTFTMCNSSSRHGSQPNPLYNPTAHVMGFHNVGSHALQDYQLQLMLLERQNKVRLMMARQQLGASSTNPPPISSTSFENRMVNSTLQSPIPYTLESHGPAWIPPLSSNYFNMIRSFRVVLEVPMEGSAAAARRGTNVNEQEEEDNKEYERMIYDFCDHIHRLMGRLQSSSRKSLELLVQINVARQYESLELAQNHLSLLLNTFKALDEPVRVELGRLGESFCGLAEEEFLKSLDQYEQTPNGRTVMSEYWKLERVMARVYGECPRTVFHQFKDLLHSARVCRERYDSVGLTEVYHTVVGLWSEYTRSQQLFHSIVDQEFAEVLKRH